MADISKITLPNGTTYTLKDANAVKKSGDTMTGDLLFADSGTTTRQIRFTVGTNDYARVAAGATAANAGWMEIATADDGNEPIYVRQYTGTYTTVKRTLALLDANGNTALPGGLTTGGGIVVNKLDSPAKGSVSNALQINYKNAAGNVTYSAVPIAYVGTDGTDGYNAAVILGSSNGTTIVGAGESSRTFASAQNIYNDEHLYLVCDGTAYIYPGVSNEGSIAGRYSFPAPGSGVTADMSQAIKSITRSGTTFTATRVNGTTFEFTQQDNNTVYTHPTYTAKSSGLYKITVDGTGHVSAATAVVKADITALGIPGSDTDTHYTTHLYAGSGTAANASTTNGNTKLTVVDNSTVRNTVTLKGSGGTTVTSDASGNVTITTEVATVAETKSYLGIS